MTSHVSGSSALSDQEWLDLHLEACRPAYESMVAAVGFERNWFVLDAGSGNGAFHSLIRQHIGPQGRIVSLDLSSEHAAILDDSCEGSVTALPFRDHVFDAVWCANTLQYVSTADLEHTIREFARVVRPGGLVAIKDVDMTGWRVSPANPFLIHHLSEASISMEDAPPECLGSLRGRDLWYWLTSAGLEDVTQRSELIEFRAPLSEAQASLWSDWIVYLAELAQERGVPAADLREWQAISAQGGRPFVGRPDFYACELQVIATGRVPEAM